MKKIYLKPVFIYLFVMICFVISSCDGHGNDQEISNAQVSKVNDPTSSLGMTEDFPLPNCGGNSELKQTLSTQVSVQKSITIGTTASISGGGEIPISLIVQGKLEAEISAAYSETFQNESSRLDSIELKAAPASKVIYVIQWVDEEYSSSVSYLFEREAYTTDYSYTLSVPKIVDSYQEICPITPNANQQSTSESTNWAFVLQYQFPAGYWSVGTHLYSFTFTCPNEAPDGTTQKFEVSDNFPFLSEIVYLRWGALKVGNPWGENVNGINPSQMTIASIAWKEITKSEADWRASNCTGTVSWDGGAIESLVPYSFEN